MSAVTSGSHASTGSARLRNPNANGSITSSSRSSSGSSTLNSSFDHNPTTKGHHYQRLPQEPPRSRPRKRSQTESLDRQLEIPLLLLTALLVCHALSGNSSLSLAHLSAHLPHSIQRLFPAWTKRLPNLAPFSSDLPNASHDSKTILSAQTWSELFGSTEHAGPFRSDAAGFGHPLTALHTFTKACLGLSYAIPQQQPSEGLEDVAPAMHAFPNSGSGISTPEPWAWLVGQPGTMYSKGFKDALYVCTWILIWTALRAATIRYVLLPLGSRWVKRTETNAEGQEVRTSTRKWRKNTMRFAEQGWSVLFYVVYWSLGLHIAYHSDYWFNTAGFWTDYPHKELTGKVKYYYLTQCAFWFHMLIVINVEARRGDHWQMLSHHIVTILLVVGSYTSHFTRVGNAVLCLMDPSDILLSAAKCLRYVGWRQSCDAAFVAFMLSWLVTRHILYDALVWACIKVMPKERFAAATRGLSLEQWRAANGLADDGTIPSPLPASPSLSALSSSMSRTYNSVSDWVHSLSGASVMHGMLISLLLVLQVILMIWFVMILRVAYKVITGSGAEDTRSSGEESDGLPDSSEEDDEEGEEEDGGGDEEDKEWKVSKHRPSS